MKTTYPFDLIPAEGRKPPENIQDWLRKRPFVEKRRTLKGDAHRFVAGEALAAAINTAIAVGDPLLLTGEPGTGKTMTAQILAGELKQTQYTILMDKLVTKYMGETSAKLRQIFDFIQGHRGVFLFDEFDAIGSERARDNDVGEMRRVLNAFLHFIELDRSDNLIIAATNNLTLLDQALFRRFDDILHYQKPNLDESQLWLANRLGSFQGDFSLDTLVKSTAELSHSEIVRACDDAIKETILSGQEKVTENLLKEMLQERHSAYHPKED